MRPLFQAASQTHIAKLVVDTALTRADALKEPLIFFTNHDIRKKTPMSSESKCHSSSVS
jgi:hypothetical protein